MAHYEYAPFGGVISAVAAGSFAEANPFRFSTKYYDTETGLVDFGERLYSPSLGRWLSRDPIGHLGGPNVYTFAGNNPIDRIDPFGMMYIPCPGGNCGGNDEPSPTPSSVEPPGFEMVVDPPKKDPDCSDCWETCESQEAQNLIGSSLGAVICRPDGCKCACTKTSAYPGGADGTADKIKQQCVLKHEETHVQQTLDDWCMYCPAGDGNSLTRAGVRGICDPNVANDYECEAYGAEIQCLASGARKECKTDRCRLLVIGAMVQTAMSACENHECPIPWRVMDDLLDEGDRRTLNALKQKCRPAYHETIPGPPGLW